MRLVEAPLQRIDDLLLQRGWAGVAERSDGYLTAVRVRTVGIDKDFDGVLALLIPVKEETTRWVNTARLLLDDKALERLQEKAVKIGTAVATIEGNLHSFARLFPKSTKMAVKHIKVNK